MSTLPLAYKRYAIELVRSLKQDNEASNWDRRNRATGEMYCIHGVNLGIWDGPDYMCGWCEDSATIYEYALYSAWQRYRREQREAVRKAVDSLVKTLKDCEYATRFAELDGLAYAALKRASMDFVTENM